MLEARRRRGEDVSGLRAVVPLSVSADKIAMAAWRCCGLLTRLADPRSEVVTDTLGVPFVHDGRRRIVEAYPAAALSLWGIARAGYKQAARSDLREAVLTTLEGAGPAGRLSWTGTTRARCVATDHALDALVCALVAAVVASGLVEPVPEGEREAARLEGWMALPRPDALHRLAARDT